MGALEPRIFPLPIPFRSFHSGAGQVEITNLFKGLKRHASSPGKRQTRLNPPGFAPLY
jgi:hypothetical protein